MSYFSPLLASLYHPNSFFSEAEVGQWEVERGEKGERGKE